ncbi:MAG TPA: glycosyltransferase family 39 protein [Myxococcales bacterium]|nr:glycosyltransferase family 39 protein [Myxococcales bacterium]
MRRADLPWIGLLAIWGLWIYWPGLDHPSLWNWDESIHMAVARGVYATFFTPHVYAHHLYPGYAFNDWVNGEIWIHKPVLPFWLGAAVMHLIGITPLGLRLASLAGMVLAGACLYLLLRSLAPRAWAAAVSAAFMGLPFAWKMVQGYQFGDVTDCTLVGFVVLAFWLLLRTIETDSPWLAAAAGAVTGLGFLCKSALALTPLGAAIAMAVLGSRGFCQGLRWRRLVPFLGAFLLLALPWEIVCAIRWPALNKVEVLHTFGHLTGKSVENWIRPWDALFNEIDEAELAPWPLVLPLVAAGWLAIRAVRRREPVAVLVTLWIGAEWLVLTLARVKVPAIAWTVVPAVCLALGVAVLDAFGRPALAVALVGALGAPRIAQALPSLGRARFHLPHFFFETRSRPGLVAGVLIVLACLGMGLLLQALRRRMPRASLGGSLLLGAAGLALASWLLFVRTPEARAEAGAALEVQSLMGYERDVGLALGRATPEKSVVFLGTDREPPSGFAVQNLLFWSGRTTYRRAPDPTTAHRLGYHPYLVSPVAQPFREVPGVPASSWLRAYDLDAPAPPPPLPPGLSPLGVWAGDMQVLGFAAAPGDRSHGRYAFYLHAEGAPGRLSILFRTRKGVEAATLDPGESLASVYSLSGKPWFIVPLLGPPPEQLLSVEVRGGRTSR